MWPQLQYRGRPRDSPATTRGSRQRGLLLSALCLPPPPGPTDSPAQPPGRSRSWPRPHLLSGEFSAAPPASSLGNCGTQGRGGHILILGLDSVQARGWGDEAGAQGLTQAGLPPTSGPVRLCERTAPPWGPAGRWRWRDKRAGLMAVCPSDHLHSLAVILQPAWRAPDTKN